MFEYLQDKDVVVCNRTFKDSFIENEENIYNQIITAHELHRILMGYYINGTTRISSTVGKKIEKTKVILKILEDEMIKNKEKSNNDLMKNFLLENGENIIKKAKEGLMKVECISYRELIKRSMRKNEMCLGKIDRSNLRVRESIEIGRVKYISYNMVEEDIYSYIKQLNINGNKEKYIDFYVDIAKLTEKSKQYILALMSIPMDTLKLFGRYKKHEAGYSNSKLIRILDSMQEAYNLEVLEG
ncbi:hypothetical protein KQI77_07055 [Clostridium sp. MSJ-8]|uniref:hypothetical protein n=1 Tax=Clostridium sp. MSJ-8 TaxID=2841510 RepID=UPI001C0EE1DD|nr:hypothetical protein [Clostridium sp. MSJ-8]MBU5487927.1 hypothetical protein [Clostridium sp. MSJ-8]